MKFSTFLFFTVSFILIELSMQSYIVYPFRKSKKEIKSYPEDLIQNDLEVTIEIGTPPQEIDLNLRSKVYAFFVSSSDLNLPYTTYNEHKSKSFINLSKRLINFQGQEFCQGYKIFESITINEKPINNITLVLATNLSYNEPGALGLRPIKSHESSGNLSFIYQMKKKANFDNYAFSIKYDDDNDEKGELIIGSYPHLYDDKFKNKNFCFSRARNIGNSIDWVLEFDAIRYDNKTMTGIATKSLLQIEFGLLLAPLNVKKQLNDKFFNSVNNKCREEFYEKRNYTIIHCDKSIDIKNFKNIIFFLKDIYYEFVLTYQDLFIEKNNEYIFAIAFDHNVYKSGAIWILGKPFMKKYQLVYDLDRKIIGMYRDNNKGDDGSINSYNTIIIYVVIISVLIIVVIALVIYIIFIFKKQRKNKAFELDDDNFDYVPSE